VSQAIIISPMQVDDTAFVAKALKEGLRHSDIRLSSDPDGKTLGEMSNWEAYRVVNPTVNDLLTKAEVLVARRNLRNLGFVVFQEVDGVCLAWVYVRAGGRNLPSERQKGVAKLLLDEMFGRISPEATLETFFPTPRWASKASSYGFWSPETL
jgi:hypothetical protein